VGLGFCQGVGCRVEGLETFSRRQGHLVGLGFGLGLGFKDLL
jgi:hypothetical protein